MTLSAADLQWPEIIQAVALQLGRRLSRDDVMKMSIAQRSTYLHQNPITGVHMFQHRVESFFSQYLLNDAHPLGHITDYVIKIEFQMRGSPHAHCLLWVKDAPKINQHSDDDVCRFIDKYITAIIPKGICERQNDVNMMKSLQTHTHSDYCCRNKSCHFGFPKPPAANTVISWEPAEEDKAHDIIKYAKDILQKVQNFLSSTQIPHEDLALADLLQKVEIDLDTYMEALQISQKGHRIILQQNPCDIFINPCNKDILHLWRGNIDLQYVEDEYSTIMYVCSYMMKSKKAMGEALKRVAKECQNDDIQTQMNKIKKEFIGKRVVGAPESAMRVLSMWLMKKSRKVTSVNTNMKDECVSQPKTQQQLAQMDDDDDENVFATSTIDRYAARPPILGNICLAKFAVNYNVTQHMMNS